MHAPLWLGALLPLGVVCVDRRLLGCSGEESDAKSISSVARDTHAPPFGTFLMGFEYGLGNEPSTHGDVYSFGVLLLEIFTGRRPTDDMFNDGLSLQSFVQAAWPERVMEILDHVLLEDIIGEDMNTSADHTLFAQNRQKQSNFGGFDCITRHCTFCSAELPQDRLDMSEVATKLSSIKTNLHKIR